MHKLNSLLLAIITVAFAGCAGDEEDHHDHDESAVLSHTIWTEKTELFVEFKPLVVNELTTFAAHFSDMQTFKAITEGSVTVSLIQGKNGIRNMVDAPDSPGIFKPALKPVTAGEYTLVFEIISPTTKDNITIENVNVYPSRDVANQENSPSPENSNEIAFLKEQAWKMDFANAPVIRDTIYNIIHAGGEILPAQGDEKTISSTAGGIVVFSSTNLSSGAAISKGQSLFVIAGGNMTSDNLDTKFAQAKSNFELAKSNYERKKELYESEAVSKSTYELALNEYERAELEYTNLSKNYRKGGKTITSSISGFLKNLFIQEGEYVEPGAPLAVITKNRKLTLLAYVNPSEYVNLNENISANFLYNDEPYSIEDFNGKLISFGKSISPENPKIPVYFELDNAGELLAGSFIEVWIKTNKLNSALVVPVSSLLEEYGRFSVIVQTGGESFEKREVELGVSNGIMVEVISGIEEGERVVTKGAFQIKMASMSGQVPAHGHSH